eukprot:gb/GECG01014031.1/.p1 GENE.gb/GECG01014031.1/~~gb/GECG01014031.1/.p1  ORF type:complete len:2125 (+),score=205.59 gb/GECG01014031.1/:1-6375(+)
MGDVPPPQPSENVRALCLLNLQKDFVEGGRRPIEDAHECIQLLSLVRRAIHWDYVFFFGIDHPINHQDFRFNDMQRNAGKLKTSEAAGNETPYCVFGSSGALLHDDTEVHPLDFRLSTRIKVTDSGWSLVSSAERDLPSLQKILHDHDVKECYIGGILTDKCLAPAVKDIQRVAPNLRTLVFSDGICPKNDEAITSMLEQLSEINVEWVSTEDTLKTLAAKGTGDLGFPSGKTPRRSSMYRRRSSTASETLGRLPVESADSEELEAIDASELGGTSSLKTWLKYQSQSTRKCHETRPSLFYYLYEFQRCSTVAKLSILCEDLTSREVDTIIEPYGLNMAHIAITWLSESLAHRFFSMFDIDPNVRTGSGKSLVHLACERGRSSLLEMVLKHKRLLSRTLYTPDSRCGFSPMMLACLRGDISLATLLLKAATKLDIATAEVLRYQAKVTRHSALTLAFSAPLATEGKVPLRRYADLIQYLLLEEPSLERRYRLLVLSDTWSWNAVHFSVCSEIASLIPWRSILGKYMPLLLNHCKPMVDEKTSILTPSNLHIAAWSGIPSSIPVLVDDQADYESYVMKIRGRHYTPLDFAILQRHFACARFLCRLGFQCLECRGDYASEFLHFLLLSGDAVTAHTMLRDSANDVRLDDAFLELLSRIEYTGTCSFTMTSGRLPLTQYMYQLPSSGKRICLVCAFQCNDTWLSQCRRLGLVEGHCECSRKTCRSITMVNERERQGYRFHPQPIDISQVHDVDFSEGSELFQLVEELARNSHEVWGASKIRGGWRYGEVRDNTKKLHPGLRPYWMLSEEEKKWDRESAKQSVCVIKALGYNVFFEKRNQSIRDSAPGYDSKPLNRKQTEDAAMSTDGSEYVPEPVDTSDVELTDELVNVVELLSKNMHETWAESKISAGFSYAPVRSHYLDQNAETSPMLVPYELLSESEKEMNRENASQLVKTMLVTGYTIEKDRDAEGMEMTGLDKDLAAGEAEVLRDRQAEIPLFRRGLVQSLVFICSSRGNFHYLQKLFDKQTKQVMEALKLRDSLSRSPLYYAVLYEYPELAEWMLSRGASANSPDENGTALLSIAAMQGNENIVELLISHGSHCDARDRLGLSALHYAAFSGKINTAKCILDRFSAFAEYAAVDMMSRDDFDSTSQKDDATNTNSAKKRWLAAMQKTVKPGGKSPLSSGTSPTTSGQRASLFYDTSKKKQLELVDISWFHGFSSHDWTSQDHSDTLLNHLFSKHLTEGSTVVEKDRAAALKFEHDEWKPSGQRNHYSNDVTCVLTPAKIWMRALPKDPNLENWRNSYGIQKLFSVQGENKSMVLISPMTVAVHVGNTEITKLLIERGADPTKQDYSLLSPYERALYQHKMEHEVYRKLLTLQVNEMKEAAQYPPGIVRALRRGWSGSANTEPNDVSKSLVSWYDQRPNQEGRSTSVEVKVLRGIVDVVRSYAARNQLRPMDESVLTFMTRYRLVDSHSLHFSSILSAQVIEYYKKLVANAETGGSSTVADEVQDDDRTVRRFDIRKGLGQRTGSIEKEVALLEQRRQQAVSTSKENLNHSRSMLDLLEETPQTQSGRQNFAISQFFKLIVHLLVLVVLFIMMTPISPDYDGGSVAELSLWLRDHFGSYKEEVRDRSSWWMWMNQHVLHNSDESVIPIFYDTGYGYSEVTEGNVLIGSIRLALYTEAMQNCSYPRSIRSQWIGCIPEYRGNSLAPSVHYSQGSFLTVHHLFFKEPVEDEDVSVIDLDSANVTSRRQRALYVEQGGMSKSTRFASVDFTIYNPNINTFASVRLGTYFSSAGSSRSDILLKTARPFNGRFAPSGSFQATLVAMLAIQVLILTRDLSFSGLKSAALNGWNWLEVLLAGMLSAILVLDVSSTNERDTLRIDVAKTSTFTSLWGLASKLELETDLLAVTVLLMIIRFVQYLRLIPGWGPMLLAFLMTWQDRIVMLYLSVMAMLIFTFGISFHVAFGTENPEFTSVLRSFYSLFGVGFAGEFDRLTTYQPRVMYTFFYMFYVLMAVIVLNLFVGIVTEIYPRASKESTEQWEHLITEQMQDEILSSTKQMKETETTTTLLESVGVYPGGKGTSDFTKQQTGKQLEVRANPLFDPVYYIIGAHETHVELLKGEMDRTGK